MKTFKSIFGNHLSDYVDLRRGMGLRFKTQTSTLRAFDSYLYGRKYRGPLTQKLALAFANADPDASDDKRARRYGIVRCFSDYLATFEPDTACMDPKALSRPKRRRAAYIYTESELSSLLQEAKAISSKNPLRGITLHAMVGLAASTGLRISEVVRLSKSDVDLQTGTLLIRQTKFAKDRIVPTHSTTLDVLRDYAAVRDVSFPDCDCPAFFINMWRQRFSASTLQLSFWDLTRRVGLRGPVGKGPRFHDLRHTFAVQRLIAWYKSGVDVQTMLPALATYMGHVHYTATAYYLTATPELLQLASDRLQTSIDPQGGKS